MSENNSKGNGFGSALADGIKNIDFEKVTETVKKIYPFVLKLISTIKVKIKRNDVDRIDRTIDVQYLKYYKKKENSLLVIAEIEKLLESVPKEAVNQLDPKEIEAMRRCADEYILAEYNEEADQLVQVDFIVKDKIAINVMTAINANDGILIIEG